MPEQIAGNGSNIDMVIGGRADSSTVETSSRNWPHALPAPRVPLPDNLNLGCLPSAQGRENKPAIVTEDGSWTYGRLDREVSAFAHGLASRGLGRGARVALVGGNEPEFLVAFFGAMRAGCTAAPISTRQSPVRLHAQIESLSPELVVAADEYREAIPCQFEVVRLGMAFQPSQRNEDMGIGSSSPDDIAMILFTSGSTGRPKGVRLTHRGQTWFLNTLLGATGGGADSALVAAPLFHGNALIRTMCAFATGGTIVLQRRFETASYIRAIDEHRVSLLTGVPTMFAMLLDRADLLSSVDLSSVRRIMMGSAGAAPALISAVRAVFPRAEIGVTYGQTEAGGTVCSSLCRPDGRIAPDGSVGFMLPGIEARLQVQRGADEGVLYLRSPALAAGYEGDPVQTLERFENGWVRTGDIMRSDDSGAWYFVGREDDMFVCGGENVYPAEVEALIQSHPDVQQVAVLATDHPKKGQVPLAFVVLRPGATVTAADIQSHSLRVGPAFLHPREVIFLEKMPLAGTQKIDRGALRELLRTNIRKP